MNEPLVSVVIPTFNKSSSIEMTVKSVLRQSYPNIEIILVDNGSTDSTREVISKIVEMADNISAILMTENLGPSNARNVGIKNSRGRYIFLLDGDDLFHPEKIAIQINFMRLHPEFAISITSYLICSSSGLNLRHVKFKSVKSLLDGWIRMTGFGGLVESTGCIDAARIRDSLLFDTSLMGSEGLDFLMRWHQMHSVGLIREPLTLYLTSEHQLHLDTSAIKENVTRLNPKYIKEGRELDYTRRLQSSFFILDSMRRKHPMYIALKICSSFNFYNVIMGISIARRNLNAYLSAMKYKSKLTEYLGTSTVKQ
jgi:glycosyltransferase involved in cell wall biosynthesis